MRTLSLGFVLFVYLQDLTGNSEKFPNYGSGLTGSIYYLQPFTTYDKVMWTFIVTFIAQAGWFT